MNYQSLKWMIDSLTQTYKCPECQAWVNDYNIDIMWAAGTTINIDIACEKCGKHSMIKTEVLFIDLRNKNFSPQDLEKLKQTLTAAKWKVIWTQKIIKDAEIVDLNKDLRQNKLNVSDLFWDKK